MDFMPVNSLSKSAWSGKFTLKPSQPWRKWLLLCQFSLFVIQASSQKYPAISIPDSLKENANMVVRLNEVSYDVKSTGEVICHERHVYTILNERGQYYANYKTFYNNKSTFLNSVTGTMYDASGKEIQHFKKKEMEDLPVFDGVSFVNDERSKTGRFYSHVFPYTVEFEEEDELRELIQITDWFPQSSLRFSVEKSVYSITVPSDYALRYRMLNSTLKPDISEKGNRKTFTWEMKNLPAYEEVPYGVQNLNYSPYLLIGLSEIEMGGYKGNMNTWNDFARFYGDLQKGRDALPEETKQKVHKLTNGLTDPQAKINVLYKYLQENSHYVGIQLGIGGWQTYDASYVAVNKYGDCKALSNFMISLLKEAGIKAHAVVIWGGVERMDFVPDFTHDPFNHVICCVPLNKDTIWLECTDQFLPAGYLSKFTGNRYGLLIEDNGGRLIHTPSYLLTDNDQIRRIAAVLDHEGNLKIDCHTAYKALCQDGIERMIHHYSKEEQLTMLKSKFNLPTYDIHSFDYQEDYSKRLPVIRESLSMSVNKYAQVSGKRIFINPDILTRSVVKLTEDKRRRMPVNLTEEYCYSDSTEISIPAGYEIESQAADIFLKSKFGNYKTKTIVTGNQIMYSRSLEQVSGRYSASDYPEVVRFFNAIYDADHTRIVLVKKN